MKDAQDNKVYAKTSAISVTYENEEGASDFALYENGSKIEAFALLRTEATLVAVLDEHYENMRLYANGTSCEAGESFLLTSDIAFKMVADRKSYTVSFDIGDTYGTPIDDQTVTYLHCATEPDPQYDSSFIITG